MNPDLYSLWGVRREILIQTTSGLAGAVQHVQEMTSQRLITSGSSGALPIRTDKVLDSAKLSNADHSVVRDHEFTVAASGIRKNPKSYGAWHHRQWVASHFTFDPESELSLCADFLRADERNFHCWQYRMWVANHALVPPEREFAFTEEKIRENFSNYSAFHYRSKVLFLFVLSVDRFAFHSHLLFAPVLYTNLAYSKATKGCRRITAAAA